MKVNPVPDSTSVEVRTGRPGAGAFRLWVPEGIAGAAGFSSIYPTGAWTRRGGSLCQAVARDRIFGPNCFEKVAEGTFEFHNIRFPVESPVEWETTVTAREDAVAFEIALTNVGAEPIRKAGAAVCCNFLGAAWWSDDRVFVVSGGAVVPLSELGMDAGLPNSFQGYLVGDAEYENAFYREFWGLNRRRLDRAVMVSENAEAGLCAGIESESAYFLHSNRGNPCTDILLAFGDVDPGATRVASGTVWLREGRAEGMLTPQR